jgi:hypothetical protein
MKSEVFRIVRHLGSYGSYRGGDRDRHGGNNLLDDLDSFTVAPLRPGPPVIKNFYSESPLITNRPQVQTSFTDLTHGHRLAFFSS